MSELTKIEIKSKDIDSQPDESNEKKRSKIQINPEEIYPKIIKKRKTNECFNKKNLLWSIPSARSMFNDHYLWPAVSGRPPVIGVKEAKRKSWTSKDKERRVGTGMLPIILWNDQIDYLNSKNERKNDDQVSIVDSAKKISIKEIKTDKKVEIAQNEELKIQKEVHAKNIEKDYTKNTIDKTNFHSVVFQDLMEKKFFVGPGDVFGGDFSLYFGGDPSKSHSLCTVTVLPTGKISASDLLAFCRVQNQVAKSSVIAFPSSSSTPQYITLNFKSVATRM